MIKIKRLSKQNYYYSVFPLKEKEMKDFLKIARKNWRLAVLRLKTSDYFKDFILNEKVRGKLAEFMEKKLKIKKESHVLDIGAGTGPLTIALARKFKTSATDANFLSLKFIKYRAEQEKVKIDLYKTGTLDRGLPFKDESFDVIVMNGVLEWVAVGLKKGKVQELQLKALKEVFRVLKKNGTFILAIENRFALDWFKGKTSHMPIKFIDLMPRKIANIVCRIKSGKEFRAYIYSKFGYKKMLKDANFRKLEFYEAFPTYQKPKWIRKTKNFFANSFIIVGKKSDE